MRGQRGNELRGGEETLAEGDSNRDRPALGREPARGDLIGRYVVLSKIGSGAMGTVYAAYDPELDRKVALKLLRVDARDDAGEARLLREAQVLARLTHPNIVAVHDVGTLDGSVWIAMELVVGRTMRTWMTEAPRAWREVLAVSSCAGEGLAAAHRAGLIHRDFKPVKSRGA